MRIMIPVTMAAALAVASPAIAQDSNNMAAEAPTTVVDNNAMDANAAAMMPANDVAMVPEAAPPMTETYPDVAEDDDGGGFPWGVIGLLGLIGLIPRNRRS